MVTLDDNAEEDVARRNACPNGCDFMKVRDVIKRLTEAGWTLERTRGDHRQFKKDGERELVTLSGHPSGDVSPGQLQDIRKKSGLPLR